MSSNGKSGRNSENDIYKAIWESNVLQAFLLIDDLGTLVMFNRKAEELIHEIFEKKLKDGEPVTKFIFTGKSELISDELKKAKNEKPAEGEITEQGKQGRRHWFRYNIIPVTGAATFSIGLIEITELKLLNVSLQERNKEQNCLYKISRLNELELSETELITKAISFIKQGFYFSENTEIEIVVDDRVYRSDDYEKAEQSLHSSSVLWPGHEVTINVALFGDQEKLTFLEKEQELLDAISEILSVKLYQKETRLNLEKSNERFRYINQVTQEVIYEHDFESDEITLSENFEKIFGYSFADEEFTLDKWALNLHPEDRDEINRRLEKVLDDKDANKWQAEFRYARKDGTYAYVYENSYIIRDKNGNVVRMIGSVKDITDQKVRELQKSLIADVSLSFNRAENLKDALNKTLSHIIDVKSFELAEFWVTDREKKQLQLFANHYAPGVSEQFQSAPGENLSFKKGKGLPGSAWKKKEPQFWRNLDSRKTFLRNKPAKDAGLKTGFAYPVMDGDEVLGVLVLAVKEELKKEPYYSPIFRELADQLASEINRKQLEEELSRIFDSAPDGIVVAGFDGYLKKVNPAFCEILGYPEEDLLSTPFIEFVHPNDRERTLQAYESENSGLGKSYFENRYVTKSGKVIWISWSIKVFPEEEVAYSVAKDITEQKEIEELLELTNRLARIGNWEVDLINDDVYWSDITREIHEAPPGFEPDLETRINFYKEGESRDRIREAVNRAIEHGEPWDLELKLVTFKGNERWVRAIGEPEIVDGKPVRLYGSFQDIHEKKELEELVERTTRMAKVGSWEMDFRKHDNEMYWSEMTREILEVEENYNPTLTGGFEFYTLESKELIRKAVDKAIKKGEPFDLELLTTTAKGNERWIRCIGQPEMVDSICVRMYGSFQDIHDRKSIEERLKNTTNNLPGIIFQYWLDPDGNDSVKYLSEGSVELWGVTSESAMEDFDRVWINAHKEDVKGIRESIVKSATSLNRWHYEWRYHHPDGSMRWQEGFGTPKKLADGTVVWDSIIFDTTEAKELELLLEQTTKLALVGSWDLNLRESDNKMYWSDMTRKILEVDENEKATLEGMLAFYKPESKKRARKAVEKTLMSGESFDLELLLTTAKGRDRWIRSIGQAEFEDGKPVRMYGSYQDIHHRKVAELELEERNRHIQAIASLNAALLNYTEWFEALENHLKIIGKAVRADRVYYFENRFDQETGEGFTTQKLEWCREGIKPQLNNPDLEEVPFKEAPEFIGPMMDGRPSMLSFSETDEGTLLHSIMESQEIKTFLTIPVIVQGKFHGFVGFDNCTNETKWSDQEIRTLKTITSNLAVAIERNHIENERRELLEEKNQILESIGDGFFALDQEWTVTYWNNKAEELLFTPKEKIMGRFLWDLFDKNLAEESFRNYSKAMQDQVALKFEDHYEPIGRWFDVNVYPSPNGISVFFKDITDRKRDQEKILQKTRQLDAIANFNSLLIKKDHWLEALEESLESFGAVADADRAYFFENKTDEEGRFIETGMRLEWVRKGVKPEIDNPVHQNQKPDMISEIYKFLSNNKAYNMIVSEIKNHDLRELMQVQDIKSLLMVPVFVGRRFSGFLGFDDCQRKRKWEEEEITFLQTISINLASAIEKEEAETALQKAFEEKNEILESIGDAFFALDQDWTVTYWNHMAEEVLHMPREKILGENLWELYEDATSLEFYAQYHKAVREQVNVHFEEYYPAFEKWFEVSAYPSSVGLSVFFKDITERKIASERLRELNRTLEEKTRELEASNAELEQFAFVASHDLQEPLRMITGFLAQLERKYSDKLDERAHKYIHFATDGAKRMRQIILDLLDYSRVGRIDTDREDVDMNSIVDNVLVLFRKKIEETNASVKSEELPVVHAARGAMQQLIQNLVSNALNYQEKGKRPEVTIGFEEQKDVLKFFVQDNGIGIKGDYSEKIFNIFQRLHGKDEYSGTGVGLAICKKIVEDHGGEIWVDSEEGKGSTFYFTIPKK
jgi:PAS domain S-box-containing protein